MLPCGCEVSYEGGYGDDGRHARAGIEWCPLHKAALEVRDALDELLSAFDDALRRYAAGDTRAIQSNMLSATANQARALLARLKGRRLDLRDPRGRRTRDRRAAPGDAGPARPGEAPLT